MLTTKGYNKAPIISIHTEKWPIAELLDKEWLLTNKRGGYASSTIVGCNTRRYHGLLISALNPPAQRIVGLSTCQETAIIQGKEIPLSSFEFNGCIAPEGWPNIREFRRDVGVQFEYRLGSVKLTKSIYLASRSDTVAIVYDFESIDEGIEFIVRPFVALRDFHSLQKSYAPLYSVWLDEGLLIRHNVPYSCELFMQADGMRFERNPQWWFNFYYRRECERGQDCCEDLWTPGVFRCHVDKPTRLVLWASMADSNKQQETIKTDIDELCGELYQQQADLLKHVESKDEKLKTLFVAADQFVVNRHREGSKQTTILAGFPWFADWGRDAFVALPGLLISTGRFSEAASVLSTFAQAADEGVIPNRFDDYNDTVHYNSIDASLWFIDATFKYFKASGDDEILKQRLLPTICRVVDRYHYGTKFGIHADVDGLITGGNAQTQLTWMDAKFEGKAFTPRYGKAVEVNALWYNALCLLAEYYRDTDFERGRRYGLMAEEVAESFCRLFWNQSLGRLNDCILPDGRVDSSLRPNQIYAVSLPFSPLSQEQQQQVVQVCEKCLLTPYGLRTLNVENPRYHGKYEGPQSQRDEAYHQGTVWPHLMGPFIEAFLKVNEFGEESRKKAADLIEPLLEHLTDDACVGSISEIFDGDLPHRPKGCIAQAWAVAELLRIYLLIHQ